MAKNIIICSDGTGNTAIKGRGTNVFKVFESVDLNAHRYQPQLDPQVAIYDDGVGTERWKPLKLLGGATGFGLSRNVKQLYKELCRIYDPGDRIFLFGFSRGAFTVRTLAGLITSCGILRIADVHSSDELEACVERAYAVYRLRYRTDLLRWILGPPDEQAQGRFRDEHCHGGETIHFIGVWDTVDAVGLPFAIADLINRSIYQFKFPNLSLSPSVQRAHHALAVDDARHSFHPLLWDEPDRRANPDQLIEQVWFSGAHSNVGGGYPKQGMSLVPLDWIMQRAESAGLRFVAAEREHYRGHANVDDKLYDPRSGLGMFYRWRPRDIAAICARRGVAPAIHLSVLERAAHGTEDYAPGNLPGDARVVFTCVGDPEAPPNRAAHDRARAAQAVLNDACPNGKSLLDDVRFEILLGRIAYWLFVAGLAGLPLAALAARNSGEAALAAPFAALALAYLLMKGAASRMHGTFSTFWFAHQQLLRRALKAARRAARGSAPTPHDSAAK